MKQVKSFQKKLSGINLSGWQSAGKRGISPLVATVMLVAFAVALGAIVMNWASGIDEDSEVVGCLVEAPISDDPLVHLQIKYINGEITKEEYIAQEKIILRA